MTDRKPWGTSFEDWAERQIREATERGDFDDLPGRGAPLPHLDRPFSADAWAADKARREGFDVTAMLPPALALRREREVLLRDVGALVTRRQVAEVVADFNDRVRELYRRPSDGPLVVVALLDPEQVVTTWEATRPPPPPPVPATPARRRRWWTGRAGRHR